MTDSTPAVANLIVNSVSSDRMVDGQLVSIHDREDVIYRFLQVDSNNLAAFIQHLKRFAIWAENLDKYTTPATANGLQNMAASIVRTYEIALTSKSSEQGGQLIKSLLADKRESTYYIKDKERTGLAGMLDRMSGGDRREYADEGGQY